ncbi:hypothetical protein CAOG_002561 [Capsaspora owczarzaki ATCC 30864]|uniref:Uncharacterized protein n=1 Tax=Capsaspora owczarzaki (strain ATCC 30864) TaxID=595528 RepID=A0A0D2WLH1_CAPO3|nr:hypothetical protein CAOG_002561 [Capsaspora owczarzaki ATCC 30864]
MLSTAAPVFTLDNVQVTAFLNPDNSYPFITNWWAAANETFHAEMYQLTINDLTDRLISMKTNAPWLDQTIIMSRYRAGADSATTSNQAKLAALIVR